jgi:glyoxylase-like metal-dependent hydrolase (beta-lactamase superfamily II)
MIIECVVVGSLEVNCYIVAAGPHSDAVVIDPGADESKIKQALAENDLRVCAVINTHGHYDHIGCDDVWAVPIYAHCDEVDLLLDGKKNFSAFFSGPIRVKSEIKKVRDCQTLTFGGVEMGVLHTPGHSPGGISLILKKPKGGVVFTGDSLFCQSIGRTDLGGDEELLIRSIKEKLLILPDDTVVYPGHGPETTIGKEKKFNPFLS